MFRARIRPRAELANGKLSRADVTVLLMPKLANRMKTNVSARRAGQALANFDSLALHLFGHLKNPQKRHDQTCAITPNHGRHLDLYKRAMQQDHVRLTSDENRLERVGCDGHRQFLRRLSCIQHRYLPLPHKGVSVAGR